MKDKELGWLVTRFLVWLLHVCFVWCWFALLCLICVFLVCFVPPLDVQQSLVGPLCLWLKHFRQVQMAAGCTFFKARSKIPLYQYNSISVPWVCLVKLIAAHGQTFGALEWAQSHVWIETTKWYKCNKGNGQFSRVKLDVYIEKTENFIEKTLAKPSFVAAEPMFWVHQQVLVGSKSKCWNILHHLTCVSIKHIIILWAVFRLPLRIPSWSKPWKR